MWLYSEPKFSIPEDGLDTNPIRPGIEVSSILVSVSPITTTLLDLVQVILL